VHSDSATTVRVSLTLSFLCPHAQLLHSHPPSPSSCSNPPLLAMGYLSLVVVAIVLVSLGSCQAPVGGSGGIFGCTGVCANGERVVSSFGSTSVCFGTMSECENSLNVACGGQRFSMWSYEFNSESECEASLNGFLLLTERPQLQTTPEAQNASCGCVDFTRFMLNTGFEEVTTIPLPSSDVPVDEYCQQLGLAITRDPIKLSTKAVCAAPSASLVGVVLTGFCKVTLEEVVDQANDKITSYLLGPFYLALCKAAIEFIRREEGIDLATFYQRGTQAIDGVCSGVCGNLLCSGSATYGGLCTTRFGTEVVRLISTEVSDTYCAIASASAPLPTSVAFLLAIAVALLC